MICLSELRNEGWAGHLSVLEMCREERGAGTLDARGWRISCALILLRVARFTSRFTLYPRYTK